MFDVYLPRSFLSLSSFCMLERLFLCLYLAGLGNEIIIASIFYVFTGEWKCLEDAGTGDLFLSVVAIGTGNVDLNDRVLVLGSSIFLGGLVFQWEVWVNFFPNQSHPRFLCVILPDCPSNSTMTVGDIRETVKSIPSVFTVVLEGYFCLSEEMGKKDRCTLMRRRNPLKMKAADPILSSKLLGSVTIANGGVLPNIHQTLQPKKKNWEKGRETLDLLPRSFSVG